MQISYGQAIMTAAAHAHTYMFMEIWFSLGLTALVSDAAPDEESECTVRIDRNRIKK
jgi:hypothetical protein